MLMDWRTENVDSLGNSDEEEARGTLEEVWGSGIEEEGEDVVII